MFVIAGAPEPQMDTAVVGVLNVLSRNKSKSSIII
jgi:hypothetical protein